MKVNLQKNQSLKKEKKKKKKKEEKEKKENGVETRNPSKTNFQTRMILNHG